MKGGYDRRLVEQLLPAVWDPDFAYGMRNPTAPDPDMPKGTVDKKKGTSLYAHLADIKTGWARADVPLAERQALLLSFGFDMKQSEIGRHLGAAQNTISERIDRGVGRITAYLNGETYHENYDGDLDAEDVIV